VEGRREDMRADEQVGGEEKNLMWQEEGTGGKQEEDSGLNRVKPHRMLR